MPVALPAIGLVTPYSTVSVNSRVDGEIQKVFFHEGDAVAAGALLFQIDPRLLEAAVRSAEGALARDQAQYESARKTAARYKTLAAQKLVAPQDYDQQRAAAEALAATLAADRANVESARLNVGYAAIRAPIAGRTSNLMIQPGNLVHANGDPIVIIRQLQPLYVTFTVPASELPQVRQAQSQHPLPVAAVIRGDPLRRSIPGTLTFIDSAIDATTGSINLKAEFPNQDEALWPGEQVDATLLVSEIPQAVVVPARAVQTGQQGDYVFIVKADATTEMRNVELGARSGDDVVVTKGVAGGETVVVDGQLGLRPGAKVRTPGPQASAATPGGRYQ